MSLTSTIGPTFLVPQTFNDAMALADRMARAKLVPRDLHNSSGDCLMVVEQAMRWGMSPFAVAQEVSVIQGRMMYSGKIVAAAIQTSGVLSGRLRYDYTGEGDQRTVTVSGTIRGEAEARSVTVRVADVATNNVHWKKQPDQQLAYHGARVWARRYVPEVMLGVYSPEEMPAFVGTTIDAVPEPVRPGQPPETAQAIDDAIPDHVLPPPPEPKRTVRELVRDKLVGCTTVEHVVAVADIPIVRKALDQAPDDVKAEISDLLNDAYARVQNNDAESAA